MKNKTYDTLKNLVLGAFPVIITLLSSLDFEKAATYAAILTTVLGWLTILFKNIYDKNNDGKIDLSDLTDKGETK